MKLIAFSKSCCNSVSVPLLFILIIICGTALVSAVEGKISSGDDEQLVLPPHDQNMIRIQHHDKKGELNRYIALSTHIKSGLLVDPILSTTPLLRSEEKIKSSLDSINNNDMYDMDDDGSSTDLPPFKNEDLTPFVPQEKPVAVVIEASSSPSVFATHLVEQEGHTTQLDPYTIYREDAEILPGNQLNTNDYRVKENILLLVAKSQQEEINGFVTNISDTLDGNQKQQQVTEDFTSKEESSTSNVVLTTILNEVEVNSLDAATPPLPYSSSVVETLSGEEQGPSEVMAQLEIVNSNTNVSTVQPLVDTSEHENKEANAAVTDFSEEDVASNLSGKKLSDENDNTDTNKKLTETTTTVESNVSSHQVDSTFDRNLSSFLADIHTHIAELDNQVYVNFYEEESKRDEHASIDFDEEDTSSVRSENQASVDFDEEDTSSVQSENQASVDFDEVDTSSVQSENQASVDFDEEGTINVQLVNQASAHFDEEDTNSARLENPFSANFDEDGANNAQLENPFSANFDEDYTNSAHLENPVSANFEENDTNNAQIENPVSANLDKESNSHQRKANIDTAIGMDAAGNRGFFSNKGETKLNVRPPPMNDVHEEHSIRKESLDLTESSTSLASERRSWNEIIVEEKGDKESNTKSTGINDILSGLDDFDKFMEHVDPPDELDIAPGSSFQEVLVQKGIQIVTKNIREGASFIADSVKKFVTRKGGSDNNKAIVVLGKARTRFGSISNRVLHHTKKTVDNVVSFFASKDEEEIELEVWRQEQEQRIQNKYKATTDKI